MKTRFLLAAFVLAAGCASKDTVSLNATGPDTGVQTGQIVAGSQADLERFAGHQVFFGYDQHDLTPQAQGVLRKQADWLNANSDVKIQLAGNCDERGTREYNLALGARRANAARDYLVSLGVNPSRLTTVSNGKENPYVNGSTESAWSKNRNSTTTVSGLSS